MRKASNALLEDLFHDLTDQLDIRTLVECGAFEAAASVRFVRSGPGRNAVAVEANPNTFESVTRPAGEQKGVTVVNVGLSDRRGSLVLRMPPANDGTGPKNRRSSFRNHRRDDVTGFHEARVEVTTIDELADQMHLEAPLALWVDVEGMAHEVLRGAERTLMAGVRAVFVEVETKPLWEGQKLYAEVRGLLAQFGLRPIARDAQRKNAQFNVIFASRLPRGSRRRVRACRRAILRSCTARSGRGHRDRMSGLSD